MPDPQTTVLVTLTGRDRPGVTSRLFSGLATHELAVVDIEQVVIRGRLILGVLLGSEGDPDLTAIHRAVRALAADLDLEAEITTGWGEPPRRRGRLHVTVVGSPLLPSAVAKSAPPCIAAAVILATCSAQPALAASRSITSAETSVESTSMTMSRMARRCRPPR